MARRDVGVDLSGDNIRIVEINRSLRDFSISSVRTVERSELSTLGDSIGSALVPFPQAKVTHRTVNFPFSGAKKIEQTSPYEMESWLPDASDEYVSDYNVIDKEKNSAAVLVAGAMKPDIESWIEECGDIGVQSRYAVPEGFAYRNLAGLIKSGGDSVLCFIDIKETRCLISIAKGDKPLAARVIKWDVRGLKNDAIEEELKKLSVKIGNFLRYLAGEQGHEPERIILCGEMAELEGLVEIIEESVGMETCIWSAPFETDMDIGPEYALALAMALEQNRGSKSINLRKGDLAYKAESEIIGQKFILPVILMALFIISILAEMLFGTKMLSIKASSLDARITAIVSGLIPEEKISPNLAAGRLKEEIERAGKLEEALGKTDNLTPLQALTALSDLLQPSIDVDMDEISLTDRVLTIKGTIMEYSVMDEIQQSLKEFEAFKKFETPNLKEKIRKGDGVRFAQKILLTEEGEGD